MKVLVTGAAGFIGSALSISLLDRGDEVVGIDLDGGQVIPPIPGAYEGSVYVFNIASNSASGDVITFKFYDDVNDIVIDLNESYSFSADDIIGNIFEPFFLTGTTSDGGGGDDSSSGSSCCSSGSSGSSSESRQ